VAVASREQTPSLSIQIPPALLPRLARHDESAEREVTFQGNAALAEDVRYLSRHLKWDVEADLSRLFGENVPGDIAAHRIATTISALGAWQSEARDRLGANIREYLTEERPALVPQRDIESFTRDVEILRDDVARLDARIRILQSRTSAQET
jgi:ubiquinone biosynthesis protein UbiJ